MHNFLLLLRIRADKAFGISIMKSAGGRRARLENAAGTIIKLIGFVLIYAAILAVCRYLGGIGLASVLPASAYVISLVICFLMTIIRMNEILTGEEDAEFLLSTPLPEMDHAFLMFLTTYLNSLIYVLLICIPSAVVYASCMASGAAFWIRFIVGIILTPLPFGSLAALAGVFITLALADSPNRNRIQSFISIFAILAGTVIVLLLIGKMVPVLCAGAAPGAEVDSKEVLNAVIANFRFGRMYEYAVVEGDKLYLILFICMSIFWYAAISVIVGFGWRLSVTSANCPVRYDNRPPKLMRPLDVRASLAKKENEMFINSRVYLVRTAVGAVIGILLPVALCIMGTDRFFAAFRLSDYADRIEKCIPFLGCTFSALSATSYCSISIEGKQSWIMHSIPLEMSDVRRSKALLSIKVTAVLAVVSGACFILALRPAAIEAILYIAVPVFWSVIVSIWGIYIDGRFGSSERLSETAAMRSGESYILGYLPGIIVPLIITLSILFI